MTAIADARIPAIGRSVPGAIIASRRLKNPQKVDRESRAGTIPQSKGLRYRLLTSARHGKGGFENVQRFNPYAYSFCHP